MIRNILIGFLLAWCPLALQAQSRVNVSGYVKDADSGESVIGAVVYTEDRSVGVSTNEFGFFSVNVPKGKTVLFCSCIGYVDTSKSIDANANVSVNFEISEDKIQLDASKVVAQSKHDLLTLPQMGAQTVNAVVAKKLPALMGETDIIRVIQMLPGVQTPSEGSTGFSVRGGGIDQNLILMDGAPIYNSGHFLGFLSMFNSDAVKDAKLYKGDFPAKYGGKMSSVLDISTMDGNMRKFEGSASIGLITSKVSVQGPILKDKVSFILSARRTYADLFFPLFKNRIPENTELSFYDVNAKVNWIIDDNNRVFLSAFSSDDVFGVSMEEMGVGLMRFEYRNNTQSARWNHVFSSKLFSNITFYNSIYDAGIDADVESASFDWDSRIRETGMKDSFTWYANDKNTVEFGASIGYFFLRPSETHPIGDSFVNNVISPYTHAVSPAAYLQNETKLGPLTVRYGARVSSFTTLGETDQFYFDDKHELRDSVHFAKAEKIQTYWGFEPRASASLSLSESMSLKAAYSRSVQYVQQAVVSISGSVIDAWFTVSPNVKPQISNQYSVGLNKNFLDDQLEFSVETFYKSNQNTIDMKENPGIVIDNKYREGLVRVGTSFAYGVEAMVKYEFEKFNGWLGYTWSKAMFEIPENNHGNPYPSPINHEHAVNFVGTYDFNPRWTASASWIFYSGAPTTFPVARYSYAGAMVPIYSSRNADRMPDYHRLDLSLTYRTKNRVAEKKWSGEWNLSIYNAYNRHNAWSVTTGYNKKDNVTEARKVYIFSVIPSLSYNLIF